MFRKILIFLLPAFLSAGCVGDDMADCPGGIRFRFRHTHNAQGQDMMSERIRDIRIYVFDGSTGVLANIVRPASRDVVGGHLDALLPDGTYTVVAWAGGSEDLMGGGFLDGDMTDPEAQAYSTPAMIGQTTLGGFRMMLACDPLSEGGAGGVTPRTVDFDDLFFASARNIEARKGTLRTVDLDFVKNTSVLKIKVTGLEHLGAGRTLEVFVTGRNGVYGYDNQIDAYAPEVRYEPPYRTLTATRMEIDVKVLRLDVARHTADPVLLYVRDAATGADMILPLDVVQAVMKARDAQGGLLYRTQEDIDRQDEFRFEISILHDLGVSVAVNGFEVEEPGAGVGRPQTE